MSFAISLIAARASALDKPFDEYVNDTYSANIFTDKGDILQAAQNEGKTIKGGVTWETLGSETKAVIYASENGDFSTWVHENAHVFRRQLDGQLKLDAEKAFGVENGNWTTRQEEDFAQGFEDYLRKGTAPTNELKNLFQKVAEFLTKIYNGIKDRIKLTPEITAVYDQLLADTEGALANAERAVNISNNRNVNIDSDIETEIDSENDINDTQAVGNDTETTETDTQHNTNDTHSEESEVYNEDRKSTCSKSSNIKKSRMPNAA